MQMLFEAVRIKSTNLLVWVHGTKNPSDREWGDSVHRVRAIIANERDSVASLRTIVVSEGGGPTSSQRAKLFQDTYRGVPVNVSVFNNAFNNSILRGIVTAALWLNPGVKPFRVIEWSRGLSHLGLEDSAPRVAKVLADMQKKIDCASLASLARVMTEGALAPVLPA